MCFTPTVSAVTAATEFGIAAYIFKNTKAKRLLAIPIFVLTLGLYQLTEFLLCTTPFVQLWARLGFAFYTFLPVLILDSLMGLTGKSMNRWLYLIPGFFAGVAVLHPQFVITAGCELLHVSVHSFIFDQSTFFMWAYLAAYVLAPAAGVYLFSKHLMTKKNEKPLPLRARLAICMMPASLLLGDLYFLGAVYFDLPASAVWVHANLLVLGIALLLAALGSLPTIRSSRLFLWAAQFILVSAFTVTLLLYAFFPHFSYHFSSIFCQFALLYALAALLLVKSRVGEQR